MNPTQLSEPVRLNRENRDALDFVRLSPQSVLALREKFRLVRKGQLCESLSLSGITGTESLKILNQFDARRIPQSAVIEWINTPEGQFEAVRVSLQQQAPGMDDATAAARFDEIGLNEDEMLTVAAGVLGLELTVSPPKGGDSTSTQSETGDAKPPSSITTADPQPTP